MKPKDVLTILRTATRIGAKEDKPEGSRYIELSDTIVHKMINCLESMESKNIKTHK